MQTTSFRLFMMLFLDQPTAKRFLIGVWGGLAFSIAIILSTIGLMNGFEKALREGLKASSGDISMQVRQGFLNFNIGHARSLEELGIKDYSPLLQTESFLIANDESKGVVVRGIEKNYGPIVGLDLDLPANSIAIGAEVGKLNNLKVGDEVVLAFGRGGNEFKNMPVLERFTISKIVEHGVYQKDQRSIYANLNEVQKILNINDRINLVALNIDRTHLGDKSEVEAIEEKIGELRGELEDEFYMRPYWREFSSLIQAAQTEKVMISIILQLIVVISIFNILAFIYFINEKKAKELFLFKALGLSKKAVGRLWLKLVLLIWGAACLLSLLFVFIFNWLLQNLSLFELPAEVYQMPRIKIEISSMEYLFVFALALVWILIITYYLLRKLRKASLLEGLRQEFA